MVFAATIMMLLPKQPPEQRVVHTAIETTRKLTIIYFKVYTKINNLNLDFSHIYVYCFSVQQALLYANTTSTKLRIQHL